MIPFDKAARGFRDLVIAIFLVTVAIFWFNGGKKKTVNETTQVVSCSVEVPAPVSVISLPANAPVQVNIGEMKVKQVFEHNDIFIEETVVEVPKPEPKAQIEVVEIPEPMPEPIKQSPLIQYRDMRNVRESSTAVYYSGGYYGGGYHMNTSRGGGNWNSRNAPVRTPNAPGHGRNTQCW